MRITRKEIGELDKFYRRNLINSIQGFKSANLIGTKSNTGMTNLAIFSSVIHVGANPPLIGFLNRPVEVERHTYQNIKETGRFTINAVNSEMKAKAHGTSARYTADVSEFEATGLTEEYLDDFEIPFVKESLLKLGCKFVQDILITANNTRFIVGEIESIYLPEDLVADDGYIDPSKIESVAISGLDAYHEVLAPARFRYAKPHQPIQEIS
jgi:flavin reductase (DIM6/NTAB) family NADH-FMN oxidoreductase RutF